MNLLPSLILHAAGLLQQCERYERRCSIDRLGECGPHRPHLEHGDWGISAVLRGHQFEVYHVQFSPDGRNAISAGSVFGRFRLGRRRSQRKDHGETGRYEDRPRPRRLLFCGLLTIPGQINPSHYGEGGANSRAGSRTTIPGKRVKSPALNLRMCVMPCTTIAATSLASCAFFPTTWCKATSLLHSG